MPPVDPAPVHPGSSRARPTALLLAAAALLALRVILGFVEKPVASEPGMSSGEKVKWQPMSAAAALSDSSGKPILYDFSAAWCGPCKLMKAELFTDETSARTINDTFVPVQVVDRSVEDGKNSPEVERLQKRYQVRSFPTLVVVAASGENPVKVVGWAGKENTLRELANAAEQVKETGIRPAGQ